MGHTVAPTQRTPMIVHHLTLAHSEQKVADLNCFGCTNLLLSELLEEGYV